MIWLTAVLSIAFFFLGSVFLRIAVTTRDNVAALHDVGTRFAAAGLSDDERERIARAGTIKLLAGAAVSAAKLAATLAIAAIPAGLMIGLGYFSAAQFGNAMLSAPVLALAVVAFGASLLVRR